MLPAEHPPAPPADLNALDPAIWPRGARRVGGALTIGGIDVRDLAGQYGTPVFVLDEEDFRGRCRDFIQAFGEPGGRVLRGQGVLLPRGAALGRRARASAWTCAPAANSRSRWPAGVDPAMITMHGSNKLLTELERAVATGVGHVVVDSFEEIARLAYVTEERDGLHGRRPAGGAS